MIFAITFLHDQQGFSCKVDRAGSGKVDDINAKGGKESTRSTY
jgi:hypothetical protein